VTWPAGLPTRQCSLGPDFGIVTGADYGVDIDVTMSRSYMTWGPTGSGAVGDTKTISIEPGQEQTFALVPTDLDGWYVDGMPVDMSGGKQSHVYTLDIKPWVYDARNAKKYARTEAKLTNLVIPSGDGVLDLDKATSVSGAQGGTVTIPDLLANLRAEVDAYKAQLEAVATAPTDAFVAARVADDTSATAGALDARIDQSIVNLAFDPNDVGDDVWVLLGQSNEVGYGTGIDTTYLDPAHPRVFQYAGSGIYFGQRIAAVDPLFHHEQSSLHVGHSMTFARELIKQMKPNRNILLVPCAHGGTGFTTSSLASPPAGYYQPPQGSASGGWDPSGNQGGTNLYAFAVAQTLAALALNPKNRIAGFIWLGGEADNNRLNQTQYAAALDNLITLIRAAIPGAANVPFLVGQMLDYNIVNSPTTYGAINAAHVDTPRRQQHTGFFYGPSAIADPTMQNGDNLHYSAKGQRILGVNALKALAIAQVNAPGAAPLVPGTPSLTQSGTTLTVKWSRPVSRVTDYNAQYRRNGGAWASLTRAQSIDSSATITGLTLGDAVDVQVRAVNEDGISDWSAAGTLTLVTLPGQPTGLAAGTPTSSAVPLTWTAPSTGGAVATYLIEFKKHTDSSWTTYGTVTGTSGTVTALVDTTQYDFRVTARNAAGSGTASATASATTAAPSPLISDVGITAYGAYAVRKVNPSATKAIQVRRSNDNATQDIGFAAGSNNLDTAALLAFVGSGSGYIAKWYDQSGNGRDLAQATTTTQPRIVNAGVVDTVNGKPAVYFDGVDDRVTGSTSLGLYAAGAASIVAVVNADPTIPNFPGIYCEDGTSALYRLLGNTSGTGPFTKISNDAGTQLSSTGSGGTTPLTTPRQVTFIDSGTNVTTRVASAQVASGNYTRTGTMTPTGASIGAPYTSPGTNIWKGYIAEVVIFPVALSTSQRDAAEANQAGYFSTT
jgi:hypothetical protein